MIYSATFFVFFFALVLYFYSLVSAKYRPHVLLISSIIWSLSWGLTSCIILVALALLNSLTLAFIDRKETRRRNFIYLLLIASNIAVFVLLKSFPQLIGKSEQMRGISFYYLTLLAFIIDRRREQSSDSSESSTVKQVLLPLFFPAAVAGPILRAKSFFRQLSEMPQLRSENLLNGGLIFFFGYFKYHYVGLPLDQVLGSLSASARQNWLYFLAACLMSTFAAYVQFSALCDVGRGAARCFGLSLPANFRPFYYAKNPNDLWARWNITLGEWIRDYFSFPMLLKFGKKISPLILIIFSFVLVGLWHGITLNWLLFGLFNGILVVVFSFLQQRLGRNASALNFSGRFLAITLFIGNGLLVNQNFLSILSGAEGFQNGLRDTVVSVMPVALLTGLIALLFVLEFFQEKKQDLDFYVKWSANLKLPILIFFIALFFWHFKQTINTNTAEKPPLYFLF